MKKLTLSLAVGLFSAASFAQQVSSMDNFGKPQPLVFKNQAQMFTKKAKQNNVATTQSFWINWGDTRDFMFSQTAVAYGSYLFNDSTVLAEYGSGTYDYNSVHSAFDVLDVKSQDWQFKPGFTWNQFNTYDVDSLELAYVYIRTNPNVNIVDTLIVQMYADFAGATASNVIGQWTTTQWPTLQSDYQTDTLKVTIPKYVYTTNSPANGTATKITVKVPFTVLDSSTFIAGKQIALPSTYSVGANKILVTALSWKSGATWAPGDTIGGAKINDFRFISYEEGGASTLPQYTKCTPFKTNKCDWNESCIVPSSVRYNANGQGWNGYAIPMWLYTKPYGLEHHLLFYKVTSNTVGVKENAGNGIMLGQNMPNPTNGNTQIDYLIPTSSNVTLEIHDITGKQVMSLPQGHKTAGTHSINVNVASLTKGVYFYTLKAGELSLTKKMTVVQ